MTQFEKNEIASLPGKYRPVGAWTYFGLSILFGIPLVGFIALIIFAVSDANINVRSYARSFFCVYILIAVLLAVLIASGIGVGLASGIFDKLRV